MNSCWSSTTRDRIQCAKRFVHQENRRIDRERSGDADPLALPSRQLGGPARGESLGRKPNQLEKLVCPGANSIGRPLFQTRHQADVFFDGHVREQADVLQHVADSPPKTGWDAIRVCRGPRPEPLRIEARPCD